VPDEVCRGHPIRDPCLRGRPTSEVDIVAKLILYACPQGNLGEQVERFFEESRGRFGANAAHDYMPHCSLTGFFDGDSGLIAQHAEILGEWFEHDGSGCPAPCIEVLGFGHHSDWHGLELRSPWLLDRMHELTRKSAASIRVNYGRARSLTCSTARRGSAGVRRALRAMAGSMRTSTRASTMRRIARASAFTSAGMR